MAVLAWQRDFAPSTAQKHFALASAPLVHDWKLHHQLAMWHAFLGDDRSARPNSEHKYHEHYQAVQDKIAGVCQYCAGAFQVTEQIQRAGVPFADEFNGHPSFRSLVNEGYQVITF